MGNLGNEQRVTRLGPFAKENLHPATRFGVGADADEKKMRLGLGCDQGYQQEQGSDQSVLGHGDSPVGLLNP